MTPWEDAFRTEASSLLRELAEELEFGKVEISDEHPVAVAPVNGLTRPGAIEDVVLALSGREAGVLIDLRDVCCVGSRGASSSRAIAYLTKHMLLPNDEEKSSPEQVELCGIYADMYRSGRRSTEDLMAVLVASSNMLFDRSTAVVDARDGEVIVKTFVPCERGEVPSFLADSIRAVLAHASVIDRADRIVRNVFSDNQMSSPQTMKKVFEKVESMHKSVQAKMEEASDILL